MFGAYRLFLALVVVFSHCFNNYRLLGASAVIDFYMLSGFVVSGLFSNHFAAIKAAPRFYIERAIRILPQYYFYLLFYILMSYLHVVTWPGLDDFSFLHLFSSFALIPLAGCYIFNKAYLDSFIPPAHSLASESVFYLLMPIISNQIGCICLWIISFIFFCLATCGKINPLAYSYLAVPGIILYFLIGHLIHQKQLRLLSITIFLLLLNHAYLYHKSLLTFAYNSYIYLGIYFGIISIVILKRFKPTELDKLLGAISYGCFLSHFFFVFFYAKFKIITAYQYLHPSIVMLSAIACGLLSYLFVEKRTIKLKNKWKKSAPVVIEESMTASPRVMIS